MRRPLLAVLLGLVAASACSTAARPEPEPACRLFQFRACKDPCGRGTQHCLASGSWSPCSCVVTDASLGSDQTAPDADSSADDAGTDTAAPDGGDAGDATDAADADAATDTGLLD